jgi:hypothetical protein
LCNTQERVRIKSEPRCKHQTFGEREAIEIENEIDRKLRAPAIAGGADMKALGKERIENRSNLGRAAIRSGSQVLVQITILPEFSPSAGSKVFSTTSST